MNTLDYVLFGIIGLAALRCWFRGIIGEVLTMAAVIGGLLAGIFFYRPVGVWISGLYPLGGFEIIAGFVAAFAVVFIIVKILELSLRSVLENLNLDVLDKIFGLVFGALEGLIIATIIIMMLRYQPVFDVGTLLDDSFMARWLIPLVAERLPTATQTARYLFSSRKA
jgi:membrane protein required for colicin V production